MSVTLTLVTVVAFSFLAGEALRRLAEWRHIILSGAEYAIIGLLVGPLALGLLSDDVLHVLIHGVWLLLGLVGFTLGLRLRRLRGSSPKRVLAGLVASALSIVVISAGAAAVLALSVEPGFTVDWAELVVPIVVLGAAGSVASGRLHRSSVERLDARGPLIESLEVMAVSSAVLAIAVAGLMLDWQRAALSSPVFDWLNLPREGSLAVALVVGITCGLLFVLFQRGEDDDARTFLATIGVVIFASGIAAALGSSPLLVGLVAGITVSFTHAGAVHLGEQLATIDQPVSIALMLFAGALFVPVSGVYLLLPVVYVGCRLLSITVWPRVVMAPLLPAGRSPFASAGLRSQGTIPIAIGVTLELANPDLAPFASAILLGVLVFEYGAGAALRRTLADAGELGNTSGAEVST